MDGRCRCGCGESTPIAKRNRAELGHVKGQPIPFLNGHNRRGQRRRDWTVEDRGFTSPCWIWQGYVNKNGYAKATRSDGRMGLAHRVVYAEVRGPIPAGLDLDHLCRVRACVNPEHLEPVTRSENLRRGYAARA